MRVRSTTSSVGRISCDRSGEPLVAAVDRRNPALCFVCLVGETTGTGAGVVGLSFPLCLLHLTLPSALLRYQCAPVESVKPRWAGWIQTYGVRSSRSICFLSGIWVRRISVPILQYWWPGTKSWIRCCSPWNLLIVDRI